MKQAAISLLLILAACAPQPQSGDVLFADDFSKPDTGWTRQSDADATTDYKDGEYQIEVLTTNLNVWASAGPKLTDVKIDLDARTADGPDNNLFGAICRYQDDKNFYFLVISADSYYAIGKLKEGEIALLNSRAFEYSDKIVPGRVAHHLSAACVGEVLTLSVNNAQLAQANDGDFKDGLVGLIAGSFDEPGVDARFDNLAVVQP